MFSAGFCRFHSDINFRLLVELQGIKRYAILCQNCVHERLEHIFRKVKSYGDDFVLVFPIIKHSYELGDFLAVSQCLAVVYFQYLVVCLILDSSLWQRVNFLGNTYRLCHGLPPYLFDSLLSG